MNEIKLLETFSGSVWAREFINMRFKPEEVDEGLMLAWFCNAIMCGHDHAHRKYRKEIESLEAKLSEVLSELRLEGVVVESLVSGEYNLSHYGKCVISSGSGCCNCYQSLARQRIKERKQIGEI